MSPWERVFAGILIGSAFTAFLWFCISTFFMHFGS